MAAERLDYIPRPFVGERYVPNSQPIGQLLGLQGRQRADAALTQGELSRRAWQQMGELFSRYAQGTRAEQAKAAEIATEAIRYKDAMALKDLERKDRAAERRSDEQWRRDQFRAGQADATADVMTPGQAMTPEAFNQRIAGTGSEVRFQHQPAMPERLPARPIADTAGVPGYASAMAEPVQSAPSAPPDQPWEPMQAPTMSPDVAARSEAYTRKPLFAETMAVDSARRQGEAAAIAAGNTVADNTRADEAAKATATYRANQLKIAERRAAAAEARLRFQRDQAVGNGDLTPKQAQHMFQLANGLKAHPAYTDMTDIHTGWQGVQTGLKQDNGFGDITAINAFQRMVDPGATVREGDVALLQSASSLVDTILSDYPIEKLRSGAKLPDAVRKRMADAARDLYSVRAKNYNETIGNQYRQQAQAVGVPFNLVGMDFEIPEALAAAQAPDLAGVRDGFVREYKTGPFAGQQWTTLNGQPKRVK